MLHISLLASAMGQNELEIIGISDIGRNPILCIVLPYLQKYTTLQTTHILIKVKYEDMKCENNNYHHSHTLFPSIVNK